MNSVFKWFVAKLSVVVFAAAFGGTAWAQDDEVFHAGPVFANFGKIANVESDLKIPQGTQFHVRFDAGDQATPGTIQRTLDSAARFINMHVEAGVPLENIKLAIVVHGGAALDVTRDEFYAAHYSGRSNATAKLVAELQKAHVQFFVCGQSAAWQKIGKPDLLPGVQVALSAMTAHALLDQDGYSLNPF